MSNTIRHINAFKRFQKVQAYRFDIKHLNDERRKISKQLRSSAQKMNDLIGKADLGDD